MLDSCGIFTEEIGRRDNTSCPTIIFKHRKRKTNQMLYLVFAAKRINKESKPQGIDHLMGRSFACKYETSIRSVRHDIS